MKMFQLKGITENLQKMMGEADTAITRYFLQSNNMIHFDKPVLKGEEKT